MQNVTQADLSSFDRDGFLIVDRILDDLQVARVLAASDRIHRGEYTNDRRPGALRNQYDHMGRGDSIRWYLNPRLVDADLWTITTDEALGRFAATLLGTAAISLLEDQLLDKPSPGSPCNLHQDYGYWPCSPSSHMISCWIALVDMTVDMGPLTVVPGSHRWGHNSNPREVIAGSEDTWMEAVARACPPSEELPPFTTVCVPAGGGVFFHSLTFHGSERNRSATIRRACSLHWAGQECVVERARLVDYPYPYLFSGIADGCAVVNKYIPKVYSRVTGA